MVKVTQPKSMKIRFSKEQERAAFVKWAENGLKDTSPEMNEMRKELGG